nr:hypothetical protein [Tanacetum cinerariifolium]
MRSASSHLLAGDANVQPPARAQPGDDRRNADDAEDPAHRVPVTGPVMHHADGEWPERCQCVTEALRHAGESKHNGPSPQLLKRCVQTAKQTGERQQHDQHDGNALILAARGQPWRGQRADQLHQNRAGEQQPRLGRGQPATDENRWQPAEHDIGERRLQAHIKGDLPGQRITTQAPHPVGHLVLTVTLARLRPPENGGENSRDDPEPQAQHPVAAVAIAECLAQRDRGPCGHSRAQAQRHGVDTGHGASLFGEVALDDAREQHPNDANAGAGHDAAGEQPELTQRTAQNDAACQCQQDAQHDAFAAKAPRKDRRKRREQPQAKHRQGRAQVQRYQHQPEQQEPGALEHRVRLLHLLVIRFRVDQQFVYFMGSRSIGTGTARRRRLGRHGILVGAGGCNSALRKGVILLEIDGEHKFYEDWDLAEEQPRTVTLRVIEEVVRRGLFDDLALVHEDHAVRHRARKTHFVGHAEHGHALFRQADHGVEHFFHHFRVEGRSRLVEQHDFRLHAQRAGNCHALLLATGQLARILVRLLRNTHALQVVHGDFFGLALGHLAHPHRRQRAVLQDGQVREQVEVLEHHADFATNRLDLLQIRAGHAETEDPEHQGRENITLGRHAEPLGVGGSLFDAVEQVEQADDDHQTGVLEQRDNGVDQTGDDQLQGLRQNHQPHAAPVTEAHRRSRFWQRTGDTHRGDHQGQHQAAPLTGCNQVHAEHTAVQQEVGHDRVDEQERQAVDRLARHHFDEQRRGADDRQPDGQINPPAQRLRVVAVHELAEALFNEHPAGAGLGAVGTRGADPVGIEDGPTQQRWYDQPDQVNREQGQQRVDPARKERNALVVPVHQQGNADTDRQVHAHGDGNDFDGLTGLIEHGTGEQRNHFRVTDTGGQRRVLRQVQVLAGQRRNDHPQCLRDDDLAQCRPWTQAQRTCRLCLPMTHRLDARAHDFCDERGGVDRQCEGQSQQFRNQHPAANKVEAFQFRYFPMHRCTEDQRAERRDHDEQRQACPELVERDAGGFEAFVRPACHEHDGNNGQHHADHERPRGIGGNRGRHVQAAAADEERPEKPVCSPRTRQGQEHREVPEQDLQQWRDITEDFDVNRRQLVDDPVVGQTRDADDEAQQGREDHADECHQQRVEQTDQENPRVGVRLRERNQVLRDAEAGTVFKETET